MRCNRLVYLASHVRARKGVETPLEMPQKGLYTEDSEQLASSQLRKQHEYPLPLNLNSVSNSGAADPTPSSAVFLAILFSAAQLMGANGRKWKLKKNPINPFPPSPLYLGRQSLIRSKIVGPRTCMKAKLAALPWSFQ